MHDASVKPKTPGAPINPAIAKLYGLMPDDCDGDFWYSLISPEEAGQFVGLTTRGMEALRARGGGSRFVRISSRCVKYRRIDLKNWADSLLRKSTSDDGQSAAAA